MCDDKWIHMYYNLYENKLVSFTNQHKEFKNRVILVDTFEKQKENDLYDQKSLKKFLFKIIQMPINKSK